MCPPDGVPFFASGFSGIKPERIESAASVQMKNFCCYILISLLLLLLPAASLKAAPEKSVLLVHSYHSTFQWTDDVTDGFLSRLKELREDVNVDVVYLDVLRPTINTEQVFQGYVRRLRDGHYDLLVLCDDEAIARFRREEKVVPAEIPILLMGWVDYDETIRRERANLTALLQKADVPGTIDLGLKLFPAPPRKIVVVTDGGIAGRRIYRDAGAALADRKLPPVQYIRGEECSTPEMLRKMETFPPDTLVVYTQWLGKEQDYQAISAMGRQCIAASRAPVLSIMNTWLSSGLVGGRMTFGKMHGKEGAEIAAEILAGIPASSLPFRMGKVLDIVNYPQAKARGLTVENLPPQVNLINRPPSIWEEYRLPIRIASGALGVIFLLLAALAAFAFRSRHLARRQLEVQKKLLAVQRERNKHDELFRITLNSIEDAVIVTDAEELVIHLNPAAELFIGIRGETAVGQKLAAIFRILPEDGGVPISPVRQALQTGRTVTLSCMVKLNSAGEECRKAAATASPIFDGEGVLFGAVLVFHRATE